MDGKGRPRLRPSDAGLVDALAVQGNVQSFALFFLVDPQADGHRR